LPGNHDSSLRSEHQHKARRKPQELHNDHAPALEAGDTSAAHGEKLDFLQERNILRAVSLASF